MTNEQLWLVVATAVSTLAVKWIWENWLTKSSRIAEKDCIHYRNDLQKNQNSDMEKLQKEFSQSIGLISQKHMADIEMVCIKIDTTTARLESRLVEGDRELEWLNEATALMLLMQLNICEQLGMKDCQELRDKITKHHSARCRRLERTA